MFAHSVRGEYIPLEVGHNATQCAITIHINCPTTFPARWTTDFIGNPGLMIHLVLFCPWCMLRAGKMLLVYNKIAL
jgi:hypothetical protein